MPSYRYLAKSEHGFIQQLACSYANRGYQFYFVGRIPDGKDPFKIDQKLLAEYDVSASKAERWRRKQAGRANVQYLRFGQDFILLATHGEHHFFEANAGRIRKLSSHPLKFYGYSVSIKGGHCVVRISKEQIKLLRASFQSVSLKKQADELGKAINALPFERYRGVIRQLFQLVKAVNDVRSPAGLPKVKKSCIRAKRRVLKPFVDEVADPLPSGDQQISVNLEALARPQEAHTS